MAGSSRAVARAVLAVALAAAAGCAARTPPPLPSVLRHPEFVLPAAPVEVAGLPGVERLDPAWRYLQNDDLTSAEREYSQALSRSPGLYPALAGAAYVALARRDHQRALTRFDAVLRTAPRYAPAHVGRGQALLGAGRNDEALAALEAALVADPALTDVARRVEVLRLRALQDAVATARTAAAAGRLDDARRIFGRALEASPDSAFLYRELGVLERRAGQVDPALEHIRRATALDGGDRDAQIQLGELLELREDFEGAEAAYLRAADIEPGEEVDRRLAAVRQRARDARLPPEFRAIPASPSLTRGGLAALVGVRLQPVLPALPERQVVTTDVTGHWAAPWIARVSATGLVEAFENHTFQPDAPMRRADVAAVVRQVLLALSAERPDVRARLADRPAVADMASGHLSYPAVAAAVASGVMPLQPDGRFDANRTATGAEGIEIVDRLRALAASVR